ncbi:gephyrin-like isoform X2 [Camponotus floridanus]|uniref:gephyrin-like isoform X2 n=1 Tax=Camponotus floridanus TaxID=104421 RepID=UPI000DC66D8A|nr:gephyrin-like isoform X2 [Camponotus floridanus]
MSETVKIKYGILTVYTGKDLREDATAYSTEMSDLIDCIKNTITQKYDVEVNDILLPFDDMMAQINSWCNEFVDTIFIIGHPYYSNKYKDLMKKLYNKNINKTIEKVEKSLNKHINNEGYAHILENIKANLEPKFHRSICGLLKATLIINLFGFNKEEAVICIDVIATLMQLKNTIMTQLIQEEENKKKINQATSSSSKETTTSSSNNTDQVEEDEIKPHKESHTDEETDMSHYTCKFVASIFSPPITKIKLDKFTKLCETSLIDYTPPLSEEQIPLQLDVASEVTTGAKSSSSETFITETSDVSMMEEMIISSPDEESSLPEVAEEKLGNMICQQYPMIAVRDALLKIQRKVKFRYEACDFVSTYEAYGRILGDYVYSDYDVPAFRCAAKHGYAVLASDGEGRRVVLSGTTSDPISLIPGTCMYVKSGARVPDEATAVVPIKDVEQIIINDDTHDSILIKIKPEFGQNIKDIGSDIPKEKLTIHPYTRIGPAELGILAATGRKAVPVIKHVSVGIFSIGDLLEELTEPLRSGYVYDSNRISLIALLKDKGFNSIMDFGIVTEDILPIKMKIKDALKQVVVLVTIGCSNDNDLLKPILKNDFDATIHFGNVFLKPGKSTTFATCMFDDKLKYLVCLPKNPVSTFVSAHLFLLPILNKLHHIKMPCKIPARIYERYILHSRPRAAWATLKWNKEDNFATAFSRENLDSDKSSSSQAANALLLLPPQTEDQKVMCESFVPACPIK